MGKAIQNLNLNLMNHLFNSLFNHFELSMLMFYSFQVEASPNFIFQFSFFQMKKQHFLNFI